MREEMIELYYEPRKKILSQISAVEGEPEMTECESAFLCGLLKEYKPKKIVEIGVAGGATTAIILQCMSTIRDDFEMYSMDLAEVFYRDRDKKEKRQTGFMAEEAKKYIGNVKHKFYLGDVSPAFLSEIGGGIDFLIIDTAHVLPGEVLDFLAALPYLAEDAIVVLHDIVENHNSAIKLSFATKVLLDSVIGNKIIMKNDSLGQSGGFPNIGAFQITKDTHKYIENCFSSLTLTWHYLPDNQQIETYRNEYIKHYNSDCIWLYDCAVKLNRQTIERKPKPLSLKNRIITMARVLIKGY